MRRDLTEANRRFEDRTIKRTWVETKTTATIVPYMTLISDPENPDFCEECPHSLDIHCDRCDSLDSNFRDILKRIDDLVINDETRTRINLENKGRFPFDQKFRKFRVWERLEQTFSGISFPNFGYTCEVGLKFRKIGITGEFRSIRPFLLAPSFSEPGNRTQHGFQFFCSISVFRLLLCDR